MGRNIRGTYPEHWSTIAHAVKDEAGWRCVRCWHPAERPGKYLDCDERCDLARHPEWMRTEARWQDGRKEEGWVRRSGVPGRRRQRVLTVAHLDDDKSNCRWWNLAALCQVCHLSTQSRIEMARPWIMVPHSGWFMPYVAGFYAHKYLGAELTRIEVTARLDELLGLERAALGVEA